MKLHVFVATTQGLVAIQNITAIDDADISSIVSINGTSTTANISTAYHNFVKKGAGIIQQDFGACSYRINISERIDHGNSWQLAFYIAHAAEKQNILGNGQVKAGDQIVCATGEINTTYRNIQAVEKVNIKQSLAMKQIQHWQNKKIKVSFLVPQANRADINEKSISYTQLVGSLEQALSLLPVIVRDDANKNKQMASIDKEKILNSQTLNNSVAKSLHVELIEPMSLFNVFKKQNTSKFRWILMCFLLIFVLALLVKPLFVNQNGVLDIKQDNVFDQIKPQQVWQVLLLTKPKNEIDEPLQLSYALIEKTITEQLIAENFEVADKALLTGSDNITDQALLQLNADNINLAIRFSLDISKVNDIAVDTWRYELSAYLIDLATKKKIETHNEYGEFSNDLDNCDKQCFSHWFANNARKLAQDMGAILVIKLKNLPRRYQFELNFQHFLLNELLLIHRQLKDLNGFISTKLLQEFGSEKEFLHQTSGRKYLYISLLSADELDLELHRIFAQLELPVKNASSKERTLVYIRNTMPYYFYYLVGVGVVFTLLILGYVVHLRRKHQIVLAQLFIDKHLQSWLQYHNNISLLPFFKMSQWQEQEKKCLESIHISKKLIEDAWLYVDKGDFDKAQVEVDNALSVNADSDDVLRLKEKIADLRRGEEQFRSAELIFSTQPEKAIKLLTEAKILNPSLNEKIELLQKLGNKNVNQSLTKMTLKLALMAFENKEYYEAYSVIDKYLHHPSSGEGDKDTIDKLIKIRSSIDQKIQPLKGAVIGQGALALHYFFTDSPLSLGRYITDPSHSFAIGYNQISRIGKQCRFFHKNNKFYLEDQGSTNGSVFNNIPLGEQQNVPIIKDSELILGRGSNTDNIALCQLDLRVTTKESCTLIMQLNTSIIQFIDLDNSHNTWPTMDIDLASRWIFLKKEVSLSIDDGQIKLGCTEKDTKVLAYLVYQNGYYIRPATMSQKVNGENNQLTINQQIVFDKMPIKENVIININGFEFSLQSV